MRGTAPLARIAALVAIAFAVVFAAVLLVGGGGGNYTVTARSRTPRRSSRATSSRSPASRSARSRTSSSTPDGQARAHDEDRRATTRRCAAARSRRSARPRSPASPTATSTCACPAASAPTIPDGGVIGAGQHDDRRRPRRDLQHARPQDAQGPPGRRSRARPTSTAAAATQVNAGLLYLNPRCQASSAAVPRAQLATRRCSSASSSSSSKLVTDLADRHDDLAGLVDHLATTTNAIGSRSSRRWPSSVAAAAAVHAPRQHHVPQPARRRSTTSSRSSTTPSPSPRSCARSWPSCGRSRRTRGRRSRDLSRAPQGARAGQRPDRPHERASRPLRDVAVARRATRTARTATARSRRRPRRSRTPRRSSPTSARTPPTCSAGSTTSATPAPTTRSAPPRASASTPARSRCSTASSRRSRRSCASRRSRPPPATDQNNRCPGGGDHTAADGSRPWKPTPDYNCDPSQVLPGEVDVRRLLVIVVVLAAGAAAVVASASAGRRTPSGKPDYTVELDNAFGIVNGADVKVAGVRAGHVTGMRRRPRHARTRSSTSRSTRAASARCAPTRSARPRPQSLIGEYFVDCRPGTRAERLPRRRDDPGRAHRLDDPARPGQQHHAPPVPRAARDHPRRARRRRRRPRPPTSTRPIRRAVPALRETDQVLAILADQNTDARATSRTTPTR